MSKEQLETGFVIETAKREVVIAKGINNTRDYVNLPIDLVLVLIEQAERVQELEFRNEITENRNYKLEQTFKDYQQVNKNMYDMIGDLKIKNLKIEQQNKRYREAREIIEQVYKDSFVMGACGYENGFTDGLDTALDIIEKALEEHK